MTHRPHSLWDVLSAGKTLAVGLRAASGDIFRYLLFLLLLSLLLLLFLLSSCRREMTTDLEPPHTLRFRTLDARGLPLLPEEGLCAPC